MSDIQAQYVGFLRSVIRSGETLPDDYDIESFKAKMNAITEEQAYGNDCPTGACDA